MFMSMPPAPLVGDERTWLGADPCPRSLHEVRRLCGPCHQTLSSIWARQPAWVQVCWLISGSTITKPITSVSVVDRLMVLSSQDDGIGCRMAQGATTAPGLLARPP